MTTNKTSDSSNDNGFDLSFDISDFVIGSRIIVETDCRLSTSDTSSSLSILNTSDHYEFCLSGSSGQSTNSFFKYDTTINHVRVLFHGVFVTVYADDRWMHTFYPDTILYAEIPSVTIKGASYGGVFPHLVNITRKEFSDWREAIWIDMESSAQNAIGSIIQQRPVEMYGYHDGSIVFSYDPAVRTQVPAKYIKRHSIKTSEGQNLCSDAIVYFTNVLVLSSDDVAEQVGFITRMYRLPELDSGAIRAARIMQKRALENREHHSIRARVSLATEIGDVSTFKHKPGDTNTVKFIVEGISIEISDGMQSMQAEGRNYAS